ncbi:MAG TPA: glycine cleavage T C-terminal barrel domain-containing protein [Thermoanaerobaculia bacterium]|nr:glycine cleavage T C-terminal barrel domain-containing protein [Thermoanaerobaculia bacterium]
MTTGGELVAQRAALLTGAGLLDRTAVGALRIGGMDRSRFLQGLVTCDLRTLAEGDGAYGFVTTVQGRVIADIVVLVLPDDLWLEVPPGQAEAVATHLDKYLIADRVQIAALGDQRPLGVAGPRAAALLEGEVGRGQLPGGGWEHRPLEIGGCPVRVVRRAVAPVESFDLWLPTTDLATVRGRLRAAGAVEVDAAALEVVRVERGIPAFGREFDGENFPQETGLVEAAVSFDKGCYLGQEVIARIHYRGGVNKGLRGIRFVGLDTPPDGTPLRAVPPHGTPLLADGRSAGRVGSAVDSPEHGVIGLAILHQRANEPGTRLEVESGGSAEVVALPFGS